MCYDVCALCRCDVLSWWHWVHSCTGSFTGSHRQRHSDGSGGGGGGGCIHCSASSSSSSTSASTGITSTGTSSSGGQSTLPLTDIVCWAHLHTHTHTHTHIFFFSFCSPHQQTPRREQRQHLMPRGVRHRWRSRKKGALLLLLEQCVCSSLVSATDSSTASSQCFWSGGP